MEKQPFQIKNSNVVILVKLQYWRIWVELSRNLDDILDKQIKILECKVTLRKAHK